MKRFISFFLLLCLLFSLTGCQLLLGQETQSLPNGELQVHFIDVGQADAALLLCDGDAMLIDGGNVADSRTIVAYLEEQNVSELDYVICTHAHEDHVGGLAGALAVFPTRHVYAPVVEYDSKAFSDFVYYTQEQGLEPVCPAPDTEFSLGEAQVTILGPRQDYSDANNTSIILRVTFGETSFLFTGDAETASESDLLDAGCTLESTVLKVGHHGSDTSTSTEFLAQVSPLCAVISVGTDNDYGHPSDTVLRRLAEAGVQVFRTDMQGHIVCTSDGSTLKFSVEKNLDAMTNPMTQTDSPTVGYIGNLNSKKFHLTDCSGLPDLENRIYFKTRQDALDAGYSPCGICNP